MSWRYSPIFRKLTLECKVYLTRVTRIKFKGKVVTMGRGQLGRVRGVEINEQ